MKKLMSHNTCNVRNTSNASNTNNENNESNANKPSNASKSCAHVSRLWSYFQGQFLKLSLQTKSLYLGIISGTPVLSLAKGFPAQ